MFFQGLGRIQILIHNSGLRIRRSGLERNIYGSTTPVFFTCVVRECEWIPGLLGRTCGKTSFPTFQGAQLLSKVLSHYRQWFTCSMAKCLCTVLKWLFAEPEPRAEELKLNCPLTPEPHPKLWIATPALALAPAPAPTPFYLSKTWRNFIGKKIMA